MTDKKQIIKIIKNVLYYGLIIFLLFVISISLFIPNGLVKILGVGWYRVVSDSMEPTIMTGDFIVVVNDTDVNNFKDGDIIIFETYFYNDKIGAYIKDAVTHHFYKLDEDGYIITYPHSQYNKDPELRITDQWRKSATEIHKVTKDDLIGRHKLTIPMATFKAFITSPYGIGVIIINIGLITGLVIIYKNDKKKLEEKNKDVDNLDQ
ncbi:signal peptidase I [Acholeplasma granularum]|uniref:signal peptidase I n=1 Tax=Acholeplasma granularum TaxID=264635 RepID=UPI000471A214|nr:signal peptidase I [Acholeplasma granularum]